MADTKISAMTALAQGDVVVDTDVLPIVDVGSPNLNKRITPQALVGSAVTDLVQTWNSAGTAFNAIKMNVTDTASAAASLLLDLQVGGVSRFKVDKTGRTEISTTSVGTMYLGGANNGLSVGNCAVNYGTNGFIAGSGGYQFGPNIDSRDLSLVRDAADTLAQRRGTNPQTFRVYSTYTDASNYERLFVGYDSGNALWAIYPQAAGTGSLRGMRIGVSTSAVNITTAGALSVQQGAFIGFEGRALIRAPSAGVLVFEEWSGSGFNRLQFGGTTSSFPALKRSTTSLQVRLADDSADAPLTAGRITAQTLTIGLGGQTAVASNTALGFEALNSASLTGTNNVGAGYRALFSNTTGSSNSALGLQALFSNTTGNSNSAVGVSALQSNTTGGSNSAVGREALFSNTTGGSNSAMGVNALLYNTTGGSNSAMGVNALYSNTTGNINSAVGVNALYSNTTGSNNSAVGTSALFYNTTGSSNSAVGRDALLSNTTGANNSALGVQALFSNTTGGGNVGLGHEVGRRFAGSNNTMLGRQAGVNISRGVNALGAITGGSGYTDGTYNGVNLTRSSGSTFDGAPTANITVSGGAVTAVTLVTAGTGFQSTDTVLTAPASSIGGTGTGWSVVISSLTGAVSSDNTLIGHQAGDNLTEGSRNIIIGSGADADSTTGSDQINIGDRYFHDRIRLLERTSDPAKPAEGNMIVWMSDGTGLGDDGDVIIASTAGGVTNYAILFDHSAGTLWP